MDRAGAQRVFPADAWRRSPAAQAGCDPDKLEELRRWVYDQAGDRPFRILIVRHGYVVAEWEKGLATRRQLHLASAAKSVYSSILGIAIAEGRVPSVDARAIDYYPEMMDVPEGFGPKPGRYAFPKDREITFGQLISNTSGYMKPGESPGEVFHYQTFGMNIVTHALGTIYGVYDTRNPGTDPGFGLLIDRYIRIPIGGHWTYCYRNFDHPEGAHTDVFGNYCEILIDARDMARLGLLWLNRGRWEDQQLIPEDWMRDATRTAPMIARNYPPPQRQYGYAFWTNDHGSIWPDLPSDAFAASGAGSQLIWMCPSRDLVVVQGPGYHESKADGICNHVLCSAYLATL